MAILIIEDEKKLSDILKTALTSERYGVDTAFDGVEGLKKALKHSYDVIILDIMLPKKDGIEVCKEIRKNNIQTPIIMLTARETLQDRVTGLDVGADDYLTKPFGIEELLARIRAVMRRRKTTDAIILKAGDLLLDSKKHEVTRAGKALSLTPKEYRLIETLMRNNGTALTRKELINAAWGPHFKESQNDLNVHMRYLRRKVDHSPLKPLIQTVRGVGYRLKD